MQTGTIGRSVLNGIAIVVAASLLGLVGLPLVFGNLPDPGQAIVWLVLAVIDCVCLLLPTPTLTRGLAKAFSRLPERGRQSASTQLAISEVARLLVATAYLVLLQAILRHPLVAVLGESAEPFLVEAVVAIVALMVLLILLAWMYRAARPLVEGMAWIALDATFATSGSEEAARAADTLGPAVTPTFAAQTHATQQATAARMSQPETVDAGARPNPTELRG